MYRILAIFGLVVAFFAISTPAADAASGAFEHVRGRILIDVDRDGEAWYVHPGSLRRYGLRTPEERQEVVRELSLGVTDADLNRIPEVGVGFDIADDLRRLAGRILIRVENGGEAWYVNPTDMRRYRIGSDKDMLDALSVTGLGILHEHLESIPEAAFVMRAVGNDAPFTTQAPFGEWSDRRQQEGCEEASALMAVRWARGEELTRTEARAEILAASEHERRTLGFYEDTSADDTAEHVLKGYFGHEAFEVRHGIGPADIAAELLSGRVVLVGVESAPLGNPHFRGAGSFPHMVLVTGYDPENDEFVTHDPGTRYGRGYRYSVDALASALLDYPSGYRLPFERGRTALISVARQ